MNSTIDDGMRLQRYQSSWKDLQTSNNNNHDLRIIKRADADETRTKFTTADLQVPTEFLRTEYMIGFTFMGLMYGLGFLVLYQSLIVPVVKWLIFVLYWWLLILDLIPPITLQQALQQLPPN